MIVKWFVLSPMSFLRPWIFRLESEGVQTERSVPLPAYNKYMGAVDLTDLFLKLYGFDRNPNVAGLGN